MTAERTEVVIEHELDRARVFANQGRPGWLERADALQAELDGLSSPSTPAEPPPSSGKHDPRNDPPPPAPAKKTAKKAGKKAVAKKK